MAAMKHPLFSQHSRSWRENTYVYPVLSRRSRGISIGVNLNPDGACNFDCVYCCVDRSLPPSRPKKVDLRVLREELDAMLEWAGSGEIFQEPPFDQTPLPLRRVNDIAFSGDGEPTASPVFGEACRIAVELKGKHALGGIKIVIITNATLLHRPAVAKTAAFLDAHGGEIWAKLDAGTEGYYQKIDRTSIPLERVIANIAEAGQRRPVVIQSMFLELEGAGPDEAEVEAYVGRLRELTARGCRIDRVQVYTVARRAAAGVAGVKPLGDAALDAIAGRVRALGLAVETCYGPAER